VFALALGYEDLIDHDELRHDPMMAVLAGKLAARRSDCAPVAGKSTLNRLELGRSEPSRYHKISCRAEAIERLFVDMFLDAHHHAPRQIVLDLDATDDPLHGDQEGRFSTAIMTATAICRSTCFAAVTCSRPSCGRPTSMRARGRWRRWRGSWRELRARWPCVRILLRADSGVAREALMAWCEQNRVDYLFGLARNAHLVGEIDSELAAAERAFQRTGAPARRFKDFRWTTRTSWSRRRRVVAKAEWTKGDANPRFIVISLTRAEAAARRLYEDVYCARGEMVG
jgi:Transposase DDE domain group 1